MCGIAGIISWSTKHRVTRESLAAMSDRIAHRGPDGAGLWLNHDNEPTRPLPQVGLVHRRLAILDPEPRSNQPFTDGRGRWIVFNGEIYNFRELRKELEPLLPDYAWKTTGDTEVLLASYAAWGEHCIDRLRGMFAFAIWTEPKKESRPLIKGDAILFLARDRMGQKPLYVAVAQPDEAEMSQDQAEHMGNPLHALAFASEIGAFRDLGWVNHAIKPAAVAEYLRWGYIGTPYTMYEGISEFYPGSTATYGVDQRGTRFYFSAKRPWKEVPPALEDASAVKLTRDHVLRAVREQMVSDVPIGCFLSGGVDSSIVALAMKRCAGDVRTFSIGFDDPRYDESAYAAEVAKHLGTRHERFTVRPNLADSLAELSRGFGQPFGDSSALPTYWLSIMTRAEVKVALSGDGGDEMFGGYDRYRAIRMIDRLHRRLPVPSALTGTIARLLGGGHPKSRRARLARLVGAMQHPPHEAYSRMTRLMSEDQVEALLAGTAHPLTRLFSDRVADSVKTAGSMGDIVRAVMSTDRSQYLPGDLLTKVDRASMLHALEVRSPFMDHELVRFAAALTTSQLLAGGPKRMLRQAFAADLPASVFSRKKMGFAVPIGDWFRGELRSMLQDTLFANDSFATRHLNLEAVKQLMEEHQQSRVDHSQRLYALLMLELWWQSNR